MLVNNFEGGTNGSTILTSDTGSGDPWSAVSATSFTAAVQQYTNTNKMHGSLAYRGATRGTSENVWVAFTNSAPASSWYGRFYFMIDNLASLTNLAYFRVNGGTIGGFIGVDSTGHIQLRNGADTLASTGTATISTSTWYRLEWNFTGSTSTTAGTLIYKLYSGDSTTTLEDNTSGTPGNSVTMQAAMASGWDHVRLGPTISAGTNTPSTTGYLYLDDISAFNTVFPGASGTTLRPSSDISVGDWVPTPSSPTTLFDKLDEAAPISDSDYVTGTTTFEVKFS